MSGRSHGSSLRLSNSGPGLEVQAALCLRIHPVTSGRSTSVRGNQLLFALQRSASRAIALVNRRPAARPPPDTGLRQEHASGRLCQGGSPGLNSFASAPAGAVERRRHAEMSGALSRRDQTATARRGCQATWSLFWRHG
jgi:hypothetical protein